LAEELWGRSGRMGMGMGMMGSVLEWGACGMGMGVGHKGEGGCCGGWGWGWSRGLAAGVMG